MRRPTITTVAVAAAIALAATACAPTTFDATIATTTTPSTSTTLPAGSAADLLPRMLDEVQALGRRVEAGDGAGDAATRIEQYWSAISAEIERDHPDLVEDFEFVVTRCRLAADRKRPADADRAYRNLATLVDALL